MTNTERRNSSPVESHQQEVTKKATASTTDFVKRTVRGKYKKLSPLDYISLLVGYVTLGTLALFGVLLAISYAAEKMLPVIGAMLEFTYEHSIALCIVSLVIFIIAAIVPEFIKSDKDI